MRSFRDYLTEVEQEERAQAQKASKAILVKNSSVSAAVKYIEGLEKENKLVPRGLINRIKDGNSDLKADNETRMALAVYIISNKVSHESNSQTSKEAKDIYTRYGMDKVNPAILYTKLEQNVGGSKGVLDIYNNIETLAQKSAPTSEPEAEPAKAEPAKATEPVKTTAQSTAQQPAAAQPTTAEKPEEEEEPESSEEDADETGEEEDNEEDEYKNKIRYDKYSGDSPDDIATKIEDMRKDAIAELEKKIKPNDWRTKQIYEKAVADVSAKLNKYAKAARAQQSKYSVHPTPTSKQSAMTGAQIAYNNAVSAMRINSSKFDRRENGNAVQHYASSAAETLRNAKNKIKTKYDNSHVIQTTKDLVKQGMTKLGDTTNTVAAKAKEGLERGVNKYIDNYDAKMAQKNQQPTAQQPEQQKSSLPSLREKLFGKKPVPTATEPEPTPAQNAPQIAQAQTAAKANVQEPVAAPAPTPAPAAQPQAQEPEAKPTEVLGTVPTPGSNAKYTKPTAPAKPKLAPVKIAEPAAAPAPTPVAAAPAPAPEPKPEPAPVVQQPVAQEPEAPAPAQEAPAAPAPKPKKVRVVKPKVQEAPAAPAQEAPTEPAPEAPTQPKRKPRTITVKPKAEVEKAEPTPEELAAKKAARSEAAKKAAVSRRAKAAAEELKLTGQPELPLEGGEGKKPPRSQQEKDIEAEDKLRKGAAEAAAKGTKKKRTPQQTLYKFGRYASIDTINKVKDNMK